MLINKTKSFTVIQPSSKIDKINILKFNTDFNEKYINFKNDNLILDFSNNINFDLKKILLFSQKSKEHKKNKKSFVIVCNGIDFDELDNEMITVPTLKEAEDIIEIEEIERDLGI